MVLVPAPGDEHSHTAAAHLCMTMTHPGLLPSYLKGNHCFGKWGGVILNVVNQYVVSELQETLLDLCIYSTFLLMECGFLFHLTWHVTEVPLDMVITLDK